MNDLFLTLFDAAVLKSLPQKPDQVKNKRKCRDLHDYSSNLTDLIDELKFYEASKIGIYIIFVTFFRKYFKNKLIYSASCTACSSSSSNSFSS